MSDLGTAEKDTTRSCIFDYPDRPGRPVPPTDSDGHPIPDYPYNPSDDWPNYPTPILPPAPGVPAGSVDHGQLPTDQHAQIGASILCTAFNQVFMNFGSNLGYDGSIGANIFTNFVNNYGPNVIQLESANSGFRRNFTFDIYHAKLAFPDTELFQAIVNGQMFQLFIDGIPDWSSGFANGGGEFKNLGPVGGSSDIYIGFQSIISYVASTNTWYSKVTWLKAP